MSGCIQQYTRNVIGRLDRNIYSDCSHHLCRNYTFSTQVLPYASELYIPTTRHLNAAVTVIVVLSLNS